MGLRVVAQTSDPSAGTPSPLGQTEQEWTLDSALWIVAGLLATACFVGGGAKIFLPRDTLWSTATGARWVEDFTAQTVKLIGTLEVLGAIGLILPPVFDTATFLTPWAATGLAIIMVGAAATRLRRGEYTFLIVDLVYLGLDLFVAWGRFFREPS